MPTPDDFAKIAKLLLNHERTLDVLLGAITDHACLIEGGMKRCSTPQCKDIATVISPDAINHVCDRHCAMEIIFAKKMVSTCATNTLYRTLKFADENCWIDLPDAVRIRRIRDYVEMVKRNDELDPPVHSEQRH